MTPFERLESTLERALDTIEALDDWPAYRKGEADGLKIALTLLRTVAKDIDEEE